MNETRKPVVLCAVCGGIAAYKAVEVVSLLQKQGMDVHVIMSDAAREFVSPLSFQAITSRKVITSLFASPEAEEREEIYPHLYPATEADAFVLVPATGDIIGKIAHGYGDDLVSASVLALDKQAARFFCPAMNTTMWEQEVVQANSATLEKADWQRIGPASGALACGAEGEGRMAEPADIVHRIVIAMSTRNQLAGKRVLVLSGPTHEHLDPVRYLGNPSSGRTGKAIAEEAMLRGATVDFITGPVSNDMKPRGQHVKVYAVTSARDMLEAAEKLFSKADIVLFAAAVADYAPAASSDIKAPKLREDSTLQLVPTPDIAATLCAEKKRGQVTIGFALQDVDAEEHARAKLEDKHLDGIILNSLEAMGGNTGVYAFLASDDNAFQPWGALTKGECARKLLAEATTMLEMETD